MENLSIDHIKITKSLFCEAKHILKILKISYRKTKKNLFKELLDLLEVKHFGMQASVFIT